MALTKLQPNAIPTGTIDGTHIAESTITQSDIDSASIAFAIGGEYINFHSSVQVITSAQELLNDNGPIDLTFTELANAIQANVFLNRQLLRPNEVSISGTTVTIAQNVVITDDEIEVSGFRR